MEQTFILEHIITEITNKINSINSGKGYPKFAVHFSFGNKEKADIKENAVYIYLGGIEYVKEQNRFDKIKKKEKKEGKVLEYFVDPPSLFKCFFIIMPCLTDSMNNIKLLGKMIQLFKEDFKIDPAKFDWADNNMDPMQLTLIENWDIAKQMNVCSQLQINYFPCLCYDLVFGIDATNKDYFKRVDERKFDFDQRKKDSNN